MGPRFAAEIFKQKNPDAHSFRVTLFGSLAATGKGHLTDVSIAGALRPAEVYFVWKSGITPKFHPNGMLFEALNADASTADSWKVYSIGGGALADEGEKREDSPLYPLSTMKEILLWCTKNGRQFWHYVDEHESETFSEYLKQCRNAMNSAIERGLDSEGDLPGGLHLPRKASSFFAKSENLNNKLSARGKLFAYALAVSEENASGGTIVTAPTCGAAGVLPAVLRYMQNAHGLSEHKIMNALKTAGLFGNIVKHNGSISGAQVGCQGEVGTACAMAAAAGCQLLGGTPKQIEYAAEMGLEHHLGMTCDPVQGLVQIPCIERNAVAAARAVDCAVYATLSDGTHSVSFDDVVQTMVQTGRDMNTNYRETSMGGLARVYHRDGD